MSFSTFLKKNLGQKFRPCRHVSSVLSLEGESFTDEANSRQILKFCFFKKNWAIPGLFFFIFDFLAVNSKYVLYKILLMPGYEPRTSGIGSDRSAN